MLLIPFPLVAAQLDGAAPPAYTHRAQNITIGAWERLASSESPTVFSEDSSPLGHLLRLSKGDVEGATCGDRDETGCLLLDFDTAWWPVIPMRREDWRGAHHLPHHLALETLPSDSFLLVVRTHSYDGAAYRAVPHRMTTGHLYEHLGTADPRNVGLAVSDLRVVLRPLAVRWTWLNVHLFGDSCESGEGAALPNSHSHVHMVTTTSSDATLRARLHYELAQSALGAAGASKKWFPAFERAARAHFCWELPVRLHADPQWGQCRVTRCSRLESADVATEHASRREAAFERLAAEQLTRRRADAQQAADQFASRQHKVDQNPWS